MYTTCNRWREKQSEQEEEKKRRPLEIATSDLKGSQVASGSALRRGVMASDTDDFRYSQLRLLRVLERDVHRLGVGITRSHFVTMLHVAVL